MVDGRVVGRRGVRPQLDPFENYSYLLPGERRVKVTIGLERVLTFQPGGDLLDGAKTRLRKRGLRH